MPKGKKKLAKAKGFLGFQFFNQGKKCSFFLNSKKS